MIMNSYNKIGADLPSRQWNFRVIASFLLAAAMTLSSCVAPPDHTDGLLENIPAVVNEPDYFSLSILGDKYFDDESWDLNFSTIETDVALSTLVLKDIDMKATDSTYFQVLRAEGDTILSVLIQSDLIWSSENSIAETGAPAVATFTGVNFTGRFEYQLIKK